MDFGDDGDTKIQCRCEACGHDVLEESDGFYYCEECGTQSDAIIVTGVPDEDLADKYKAKNTRHSSQNSCAQSVNPFNQAWLRFIQEESQSQSQSQNRTETKPRRKGDTALKLLKERDHSDEVRIRYVMGMQWRIELQCEALVKKFRVSPLVCGVAGSIWLRYVVASGVLKDDWADDALKPYCESQDHKPILIWNGVSKVDGDGKEEEIIRFHKKERGVDYFFRDKASQHRAVVAWIRQLKKKIPLSSSLAICYLACHVARESILPTDIVKWSLEGKLPYFTAHTVISERFGGPSLACPISSSLMFRPSQTIPLQKLESMAASIAESVGLHLPPVNFYGIASRYLEQLSLPVKDILPHACRVYEWSMPPDLWLSSNELRLPTRVCVLSILIVAIRILYDINGFGAWERSLCGDSDAFAHPQHISGLDSMSGSAMKIDTEDSPASPREARDHLRCKSAKSALLSRMSERDTAKLLTHLEASYDQIGKTFDYTKDLPSYLQYCKDVVFAGIEGSNPKKLKEEEELIDKLCVFYFSKKRLHDQNGSIKNQAQKMNFRNGSQNGNAGAHHVEDTPPGIPVENHSSDSFEQEKNEHSDTVKDRSIRRLKLEMEENRFSYIPPRANIKGHDYLHYVRKNDEGAFTYAAHADYYILLRSCARVAEVDVRVMHIGVLNFEKRLAWLEKRIDHCLCLTPPSLTCKLCGDPKSTGTD